jgi:hypothetical protein
LDEKNAILRNHILAFHQFVEYLECEIVPVKNYPLTQDHCNLLVTLQACLASTHPIHRWSAFDKFLTPLLFGLRIQLLTFLHPIPESYRVNDQTDIPRVIDIDPGEMGNHPWELAFRDLRSQDRLFLMLSLCRGALTEQRNLKAISIPFLCLRLAKGTFLQDSRVPYYQL